MRLLSGLAVAVVICLLAIGLPAAPAQAQDGPSITLSPRSGVPGQEVTIYGSNFTPSKWVDIYYYPDSTGETRVADIKADANGDFRVKFTVPGSYTGKHRVLAEDQEGKSAYDDFTVKPGLTVDPEEGPVGTNVTVKGLGFAKNERNIEVRYYVNGSYETVKTGLSADASGSWQWSFRTPISTRGNHKIDAKGEDSTFAAVQDATFRVAPAISLERSSGNPGESINIAGSGFGANERDIKILFAAEQMRTHPEIIRADASGYWQGSFEVPEKPAGNYSVTADGVLTPKEEITPLSFEIVPGLVLSPAEGHVGTNLTVIGRGFAINKDVVVMYGGDEVATDRTNNKGSFNVTFVVPESPHGARTVTARDAAANNATGIFTMESEPPDTPELISPPDGSRVGLVGNVRPTFEWSEVFDPSLVYYSLQIATSPNVTASGFANVKLSITGITGTNYTLNATEALPYGTYYWIVQAVDRAENASNWTAPRSFRAGLMPLWGFIAGVVAIVVVIGTALYFFILKKRISYY